MKKEMGWFQRISLIAILMGAIYYLITLQSSAPQSSSPPASSIIYAADRYGYAMKLWDKLPKVTGVLQYSNAEVEFDITKKKTIIFKVVMVPELDGKSPRYEFQIVETVMPHFDNIYENGIKDERIRLGYKQTTYLILRKGESDVGGVFTTDHTGQSDDNNPARAEALVLKYLDLLQREMQRRGVDINEAAPPPTTNR